MSVYPPPNYTEPISTFNPANWIINTNDGLSRAEADLLYLHFPVAQGLETLQQIVVNGTADFNSSLTASNNIIMDGVFNTNYIEFPDATRQYTAPTLPSSLLSSNNIWTGTNEFQNTTQMDKPLTMTGVLNTDRIINNVYYQFQDTNSLATNVGQIYAGTGVFNYDNDANGGTHNFATNTAGGVQTIPLAFNSVDMTIGTTNPPTCSASSTIATSDNSTKIPSTAWVKSVLPVIPTTPSTLAYFRTGLIAGNQAPLATPLIINVNTGTQTGSGITMCPLVFRMTCSYTNATTPANQIDAGSVSTFCNTVSCIFNYFVYNSQPVVSGTNVNYFNNAMGGSGTSNTAYFNNVVYGNTYGRPFWTTNLSNEANVSVIFPFTFTGTPFLNGLKQIVFNPPAVGYPAISSFYWEWTIEVLNKANFAGMITSTGFDVNLNC